jgi:hypothetical protein
VLELDYRARHIRLHDPASFSYAGPGQTVPIEFVGTAQPTIQARVTPRGRAPIEGRFLLDIGAGSTLVLHSPFVAQHNLLATSPLTIRAIGGAGAGGRTTGRLGRVDSLQIASYVLEQPIALFSQDKAGAFANADLAGNIGAQVTMRFRTFLDYGRRRVIFEATPETNRPFDRAFSGVALRAVGADYRTFRVIDVLENSPATEAGLREGDIITAIDDVGAADLTLSAVNDKFDEEGSYRVTVRRGTETLVVTLAPRKMI